MGWAEEKRWEYFAHSRVHVCGNSAITDWKHPESFEKFCYLHVLDFCLACFFLLSFAFLSFFVSFCLSFVLFAFCLTFVLFLPPFYFRSPFVPFFLLNFVLFFFVPLVFFFFVSLFLCFFLACLPSFPLPFIVCLFDRSRLLTFLWSVMLAFHQWCLFGFHQNCFNHLSKTQKQIW